MTKDIQIKFRGEDGVWEELYPATKSRIVTTESGKSLEEVLTSKTDISYVDSEIERIDNDKANKKQEDWIVPTLQNGWVAYSAGDELRYRKDELGIVYINGRIKDGQTGTIPVFRLPSGYIPDRQYQTPINCGNAYGVGIVVANGDVWVFQGSNTSVFFDLKIPTL